MITSRKRQHTEVGKVPNAASIKESHDNDEKKSSGRGSRKLQLGCDCCSKVSRATILSRSSNTSSSRKSLLPLWNYHVHHNHQSSLVAVIVKGTCLAVMLVTLYQAAVYYWRIPFWLSPIGAQPQQQPPLDFVVAGFPKCGTTTLLYAFQQHQHENILMSNREVCAMKDKRRPEHVVDQRYRRELLASWNVVAKDDNLLASYQDKQKGIKCPTILYSDKAIDRLLRWYGRHSNASKDSSSTTINTTKPLRWIIGMRHPMRQVQSYYNYLVTEVYDKGYWFYKGIRSLESILLGTTSALPWKDMAPDSHLYEIHLERLLSRISLENDDDTSHPPRPTVLVYTLEQMETTPSSVSSLARDLQTFVGATHALSWGHENRNHFTGARAHPETIDLCSPRFDTLRHKLLRQSQSTAQWIEEHILSAASPYHHMIQVGGGVDALREQVQTWKRDICDNDGNF